MTSRLRFASSLLGQTAPIAACLALLVCFAPAEAAEPLHARIDGLIAAAASDQTPSPPADDAEFLRRIYLDLAGKIPAAAEAREFLADTSPQKREKLIDRLLAGSDFPRRMEEQFHVMFMERLGEHEEWSKFLRASFAENKPWDQICREILAPDAENEATRGSAFFFTKRLENYGANPVDLPGLARDVGRLFLGVDVQCAQCHDHLFVDDYKQIDFQGLFSFVSHMYIRRDLEFPAVGERLVSKKTEFMSVFLQEPRSVGPRLPFGTEVEIPQYKGDDRYIKPPDRKTRFPGIPKFSPLRVLAEQLPQAENRLFTRNAANRFWWMLMGRGLVHPLDLFHADNPPSHPELLDLLADEFAASGFDVKRQLREIALSQTYQRSSVLPDGTEAIPNASFLTAIEKPLSAEQLLWSMLEATGELARVAEVDPPDEGEKSKEDEKPDSPLDTAREAFRAAFANPPREPEVEFSPSVKAALFVLNGDLTQSWLRARDGNLVDRLTKIEDADALAGELYLSVLSRSPTDDERAEAAEYLAAHGDRRTVAVGHLAWALLASAEFCVNH